MENKVQIPKTLPLLPVKDTVVFPYTLLSLYVAKESAKKAIEEALSKSRMVFLSSQKKPVRRRQPCLRILCLRWAQWASF